MKTRNSNVNFVGRDSVSNTGSKLTTLFILISYYFHVSLGVDQVLNTIITRKSMKIKVVFGKRYKYKI